MSTYNELFLWFWVSFQDAVQNISGLFEKKKQTDNKVPMQSNFTFTVEPVLSGTVLSGHPLLSGQLSKSRKLCTLLIIIVNFTSIKWSPLLSGCGHPLLSPNELFLLS